MRKWWLLLLYDNCKSVTFVMLKIWKYEINY